MPEKPEVDESDYQLSTGDQLPTEGNVVHEIEESDDATENENELSEEFLANEEKFLHSIDEHFEQIGLSGYLEGREFYIKEVDEFQAPAAISDRGEYTYYLEGILTAEFDTLTDQEQYDLLTQIYIGEIEYYGENMFEVESIDLISDTDTFTRYSGSRTAHSLEKNGEEFLRW